MNLHIVSPFYFLSQIDCHNARISCKLWFNLISKNIKLLKENWLHRTGILSYSWFLDIAKCKSVMFYISNTGDEQSLLLKKFYILGLMKQEDDDDDDESQSVLQCGKIKNQILDFDTKVNIPASVVGYSSNAKEIVAILSKKGVDTVTIYTITKDISLNLKYSWSIFHKHISLNTPVTERKGLSGYYLPTACLAHKESIFVCYDFVIYQYRNNKVIQQFQIPFIKYKPIDFTTSIYQTLLGWCNEGHDLVYDTFVSATTVKNIPVIASSKRIFTLTNGTLTCCWSIDSIFKDSTIRSISGSSMCPELIVSTTSEECHGVYCVSLQGKIQFTIMETDESDISIQLIANVLLLRVGKVMHFYVLQF